MPDPTPETNSDRPALPAKPVSSELQLLIRGPMIGHMLVHRGGVVVDTARLALCIIPNRRGESRVCDVMRRMSHGMNESSWNFVLSLRAWLEPLQLLVDAILNSLVVASLEMQAVKVAPGSPITAVQRLGTHKEHGHRDRLRTDARHLEHECRRHRRADTLEKIQVEIRLMPVTMKGVGIILVDDVP